MWARLQLIGGALASIAAVGAVAGGLVGYWTVWKTLRTDVFPENQKTQKQATVRPDVAPRLSVVVLPFANLNNDAEQDYFADGITTDLTTDLAQMPETFVIGRGTAFTYTKQVDLKTPGKDLGIRWAVQGAVQRAGDRVRMNVTYHFPTCRLGAGEAFSPIQIALRLSPKDPAAGTWRFFLCHAHVHLRQYKEGIEEYRRSINLNKSDWFPYVDLISAYGATGQSEMAQQVLVELNAIRPDFTIQWFKQIGYARSSNPQFRREYDGIVEGLRKAGVREQ
nr:hypothetical protein [Bradyrhizobium sp. 160]